jgi:hypothetical protein
MSRPIDYVWNVISFPESALLGKRVPKKQFLESGGLAASDKKLFRENVKSVYWEYTLKPSTCSVLPFRDNEREYLEVAILQIELASQKGHRRIAEIIHRVIPYPLILGFYTGSDEFALSIAPKRFSHAEQGAFVAERYCTTGWMKKGKLNEWEASFIASLAWNNMPLQHYGALYSAWADRLTGYECSVMTGTFTLGKAGDRFEHLTQCREIESKISELRRQLKKSAFNRQVELNTQIKKFEQELKQLAASL